MAAAANELPPGVGKDLLQRIPDASHLCWPYLDYECGTRSTLPGVADIERDNDEPEQELVQMEAQISTVRRKLPLDCHSAPFTPRLLLNLRAVRG